MTRMGQITTDKIHQTEAEVSRPDKAGTGWIGGVRQPTGG
jgi:hypothetical protein